MEVVAEEQAAASLAVVESLALGRGGRSPSRAGLGALRTADTEGLRRVADTHTASALTVRGIVAGTRNCVYQHLRAGNIDALPASSEAIVDWMLCFDRPAGETVQRAATAARRPAKRPASSDGDGRDPEDKRGRIVCAAAKLGFENGYEALSIPAISAEAGISNQTFYEHFPGKREAFQAGFDMLAEETMRAVAGAAAAEREGPEAIGAGLRALLEHIAEDEMFARLAFFELTMAGPAALDQADRILGGFTSFFSADAGVEGAGVAVPPVILEALGGGTWAVIQHEIAAGRCERLPQQAAEIVEFVVAPFEGAEPDVSAGG